MEVTDLDKVILLFDNGDIIPFKEKWPTAECTHYAIIGQHTGGEEKLWWQKLGIKFDGKWFTHPCTNTYDNLDQIIEELNTLRPTPSPLQQSSNVAIYKDALNQICFQLDTSGVADKLNNIRAIIEKVVLSEPAKPEEGYCYHHGKYTSAPDENGINRCCKCRLRVESLT